MMNKIEAVIFDSGGVLHANNTAVTDDLSRELGLEEDVLKQIWMNQIPLLGSGKINEADFWRQVSDEYGIRPVGVTENLLGRAYAKHFEPHIPVLELVKDLGAHGIKLAVLSNTIGPHAEASRKAGLYAGFDYIFLSHEVGFRKPDPRIYQLALDEMQVAPSATLFVDDDAANVAAAEELGIRGLVFKSPEQAVDEIRSLIGS